MEEPDKGLSTSGTSEPKVSRDEKVGAETREGSVECRGQVQMEGSLSEELVGEGGACNGEDAVVGVMGSDVYIDGVSTRRTGTELNDEVGGGDSVEVGEDLGKDMKSAGIGSGTEDRFEESGTVESEEARGEYAAVELDDAISEREVRDQAVVVSGECDAASVQDEALLDDSVQKEVGTGEALLDDRGQKEVGTGEALLDDRGTKEVGTDEALLDDRAHKEMGTGEALLDDRAQKEVGTDEALSDDRAQKEVGTEEALSDDRAQKVDRVQKKVGTGEALLDDGGQKEVGTGEALLDDGGQKEVGTGKALLDDRGQKEVGTGDSSGNIEVPIMADVGVDCIKAADAGAPNHKLTNTRCDSALECSLTGSSVGGENVQCRRGEKDNQKDKNVIDHGTPEDGNDVTLETLDEQKTIGNLQGDKMLDKEACISDKVEVEEKLNSNEEQPIGKDKVDDNSNDIQEACISHKEACMSDKIEVAEKLSSNGEQPIGNDKVDNSNNIQEVVGVTEVAIDKALSNSDEKQSLSLEKGNQKEQMTDTSRVSSDTGQITADKDISGVSALDVSCSMKEMDVSDAEHSDVHKGIQIDVEDQPETERNKIMKDTAEIKGTSVSIESEKIFDANATVEKDTQVTDKGPMVDGKEKINDESNMRQNVEEQAGISELVGSNGGQEIEEEFNEAEKKKPKDRKAIKRALTKPGNSEVFHQARYSLPTEKEGVFSLSDMVWGKVRSHPWWPGQIFDRSDASERALKHRKKDCHLVAYFGDRTFAWNEASQLKPFRTHFSSIEKQSTSESFHNAVDCALDEVTRRVEYGLACSCIPKGDYDTIKYQAVENAGIRQELKFRLGVDKSLNASSFSPTNLVEYLKTLSELPTGGFDRLELVIAKAQLLAFNRFKGYSCLPELQHCGDLDSDMENSFDDDDDEKKSSEVIEHATPVVKNDGQAGLGNLKNQSSSRPKRKHNLKDTMHPTKKERRLSDLKDRTPDSPDGDCWSDEKVTDNPVSPGQSKKRRAIDHYADDFGRQEGRKTISVAKVSNTTKSSFKIGDCIRRVASQLTGSPSMSKCSSDRPQKTDIDIDGVPGNGSDVSLPTVEEAQRSSTTVPTEYSSLDDLLSLLQLVALEPLGEYSFPNAIVSFFSDFRNSIIVAQDSAKEMLCMDKVGTKRKKPPIAGSPETFEFEDMNDTYWTDRVIDNGNEEQPAQQAEPVQAAEPSWKNRKKDHQHVPAEPGKPVQVKRRYSKKQYSYSNHAEAPEKPPGYIDENAPAELVMNFAELDSVPSEANLNKMFRRFGPLKESETEVDRVSCRARVVFKKCVDAEVACSSAKKFNIFGPVPVNYQLNYTPSALFNASSVATAQDQEMHLDLSNFEVDMV